MKIEETCTDGIKLLLQLKQTINDLLPDPKDIPTESTSALM